jgi:hypothetical protein
MREGAVPPKGRLVHGEGLGFVVVFRTISPKGDAEYGATHVWGDGGEGKKSIVGH